MGQDERIELFIAYSNKRKEINPDDVAKDFHPNCTLILLDLEKEINPKKDYKGYLEIKKTIKNIEPHVVHLHSSKAGILGRLALRSFKNITSFYTPHGYSFLREDITSSKKRFYKSIEYSFSKLFSTTTVACGDTELLYARELNKSSKLIRNGIVVSLIDQFKSDHQNKILTVGIVGRITYARSPELFNSIALALPEIQFKWIGDGELREKITAPNIQITGWFTDRNKALEHMAKIDIYLQTSLWEGLPIALLEAMVLEKPIVATHVIGNKDVVVHGKTGYLFNTKDEAVQYIRKLSDKKLRVSMGDAANQRARELYDCRRNFHALVDLYLS